jgi:hypothetical protein
MDCWTHIFRWKEAKYIKAIGKESDLSVRS